MTTLLLQSNSPLLLEGRSDVNDYDMPLKADHGLIDAMTEQRCTLVSDKLATEVPPSTRKKKGRYKNMLLTVLGQRQHDDAMSIKLTESTSAQSSRVRRKLEMAAELRRLSNALHQQIAKHGNISDSDDSFYCDDDDLEDSIHLAKKRYGSKKSSLCSNSWEAKSGEELLKDTDALVSPRSLPSEHHRRSTRGAMAA
jgi:hypothetical protein